MHRAARPERYFLCRSCRARLSADGFVDMDSMSYVHDRGASAAAGVRPGSCPRCGDRHPRRRPLDAAFPPLAACGFAVSTVVCALLIDGRGGEHLFDPAGGVDLFVLSVALLPGFVLGTLLCVALYRMRDAIRLRLEARETRRFEQREAADAGAR